MARNSSFQLNKRTAALAGSGYFLLLGVVNLVATMVWSELRPLDFITAAVCILPFLIQKRSFLMGFGILAACISLYAFAACFLFSVNPEVETSRMSFFMGFLLTGTMLGASLLLIFAGRKSGGEYHPSI